MSVFILGFMALLLYHLMTSVDGLRLVAVIDGLMMPLAEGWNVCWFYGQRWHLRF